MVVYENIHSQLWEVRGEFQIGSAWFAHMALKMAYHGIHLICHMFQLYLLSC